MPRSEASFDGSCPERCKFCAACTPAPQIRRQFHVLALFDALAFAADECAQTWARLYSQSFEVHVRRVGARFSARKGSSYAEYTAQMKHSAASAPDAAGTAPKPYKHSGFRHDIGGLRAIAVTLVVLFHYRIGPVRGGFIGVDVFFVISGFLMTKIVSEGVALDRFSLARFYQARARRIVPALAVMVAGVLTFGWFAVDPLLYSQVAAQGLTSLLFVSNIYYFLTAGYFSPSAEAIWFLHTWSLSVEWQFYLLFPLIWAAIFRRMPQHALKVLAIFTTLAFAADVSFGLFDISKLNSLLFYMFFSRAPEMTAGGVIYLLQSRSQMSRLSRTSKLRLEAAGIVLILGSALISRADMPWPGPYTLLPVAGTMLVLLADRGRSSLVANSVFAALGRWSYSIYLWHWPLIVGLTYWRGDIDGLAPVMASLSIAAGAMSYHLIEEVAARGRQVLAAGVPRPIALVFVGTIAACTGILAARGVAGRASPAARLMIADAAAAAQEWDFPTSCNGRLCTLGTGRRATTLVVGDSHAEMWFPALLPHAQATGRTVDLLATAGCAPVPGIVKIGNRACERSARQIRELVEQHRYQHIVFIASWFDYLQPSMPATNCVRATNGCLAVDSVQAADMAKGRLSAFVKQARGTGAQVTVLAPVPLAPFDVPRWIAAHAFRGELGTISTLAKYPISSMPGKPNSLAPLWNALRKVGIIVPDPGAGLCAEEYCRLVDNRGNSLYKDNNHLRAFVIRQLPVDWVDG